MFENEMALLGSLIYIYQNNDDRKIEPCGTPYVFSNKSKITTVIR